MRDIRTALCADLTVRQNEQCLALLSDAFVSDAGLTALWGPHVRTVPKGQAREWFVALFDLLDANRNSVLAVIKEEIVVGIAVTTQSDRAPSGAKMLGWVWRMLRAFGPCIITRTMRHDRRRALQLPKRPALIVEFICVADDQRGQGLAGKLFDHVFQTAISEHRAVWLETTKPHNVAVFSKYGFVESGRYHHLDVLNICMQKKD